MKKYVALFVASRTPPYIIEKVYTNPSITKVKDKAIKWCREETQRFISMGLSGHKSAKERVEYWKKRLERDLKLYPNDFLETKERIRRYIEENKKYAKAFKKRTARYRKSLRDNINRIKKWKGKRAIILYLPSKSEGLGTREVILTPLTLEVERAIHNKRFPEYLLRRR